MDQPLDPHPDANRFEPPTAERLRQHLDEHPAAPPSVWRARLPLIVMGLLVLSLLLATSPVLAIVPWGVLILLMLVMSNQVRRRRQLHAQVVRGWELAMLREHRAALGRAWRLLPKLRSSPELHTRAVVVMAHCLDDLAAWDAALVAYDALLERLPRDHPLSAQVRVRRASAALCDDRLADADHELNRLRGNVEAGPESTSGCYHLARLVQDVRTGHYADAIEQTEQTAAAIKPLGIEAGYGYGLLALCHHVMAPREDDADAAASMRHTAKRWWARATLLVPPAALAYRFPEMKPMFDQNNN